MRRSLFVAFFVSYGLFGQSKEELEGKGFDWSPALRQSAMFLGIQHGFRVWTEPGTRQLLRGPFIKDYFHAARGVRGWGDGDPPIVNYVGHPMMGAVAGYIQVQNDPRGRTQTFSFNGGYWKSRMKALGWSTAYSLQFELGPLSEASIGNVGHDRRSAGAVDLVVTPVVGLAWQTTEDAVDRFVVAPLERHIDNRAAKLLARSMLNPSRAFANLMRGKVPWYRDYRSGLWKP